MNFLRLNKIYKLDNENYLKNQKVIDLVNDFDKDCDILIKSNKVNGFFNKLDRLNKEKYNHFIKMDFSKEINERFLSTYKETIDLKKTLANEELISNVKIFKYVKELKSIINEYELKYNINANNIIDDKMDKYSEVYKLNKEMIDSSYKNE